jgi:hypothetical protein
MEAVRPEKVSRRIEHFVGLNGSLGTHRYLSVFRVEGGQDPGSSIVELTGQFSYPNLLTVH